MLQVADMSVSHSFSSFALVSQLSSCSGAQCHLNTKVSRVSRLIASAATLAASAACSRAARTFSVCFETLYMVFSRLAWSMKQILRGHKQGIYCSQGMLNYSVVVGRLGLQNKQHVSFFQVLKLQLLVATNCQNT